ncbi:MAG: FAD-dependent oxidoreductase [Verrucomicrobiales bacterium]
MPAAQSNSHERRVAVLGAGIMGCSVALMLARAGMNVTLIDREPGPFAGASRWNEGKIHLGYLYSGDRTLATARGVVAGGLLFKELMEELIGCSIDPAITPDDDLYLVHRDSISSVEETHQYYMDVTALVRKHQDAPRYLVDASDASVQRLSATDLSAVADQRRVLAGFRVPERSVATQWIADRFVETLQCEGRIELAMRTHVSAVRAASDSWEGDLCVEAQPGISQRFDVVINALWHGRIEIDRTAGVPPEPGWSHRYRLSLFVRTNQSVQGPSAVLATGPFGDIKNYNGRDFYLSWYPAGLKIEAHTIEPPATPVLSRDEQQQLARSVFQQLEAYLPWSRRIASAADVVTVGGGWVFAQGHGSLADRHATIHQRDRFGIRQKGAYISVDTGKYSMAPFLAREVMNRINHV